MSCAGRHHSHAFTSGEHAVDDSDIGNDASIRVVNGVEDHRACWPLRVTRRRGNLTNNLVKEVRNALTGLTGDAQNIIWFHANELSDFLCVFFGLCARKIDLVQDRDDGQIVL